MVLFFSKVECLKSNPICPLLCRTAVIKSGVRNGFSKIDGKCVAPLFEHFVDQIEHFHIDLNTKHLAKGCKVIEERRIFSIKVDGNYIAFGFNRFGDEGFLPLQFSDSTLYAS